LLNFTHVEDNFVDFKVQRLLPNVLSTQGPHMAKGDINGDGKEDIFICGAKGQESKVFIQTADGKFKNMSQPDLAKDSITEDTDALFFDADQDGDLDLGVVSGGYCFPANDPALQPRIYFNDGKGKFSRKTQVLPSFFVNASCLKAADIDQDGDQDLFVGGRVVPGQYPESPESYLLVNNGKGQFSIETDKLAPQLKNIGMVTDALWLDLNNDKALDLVIVGEWMPIQFFINQQGKLVNQTKDFLAAPSSGWWNCISAGDFDADGDLDLVAGNLGSNSQMKVTEQQPASLLYKDFDSNGTIDPVLSYYIEGKNYPAFSRDELVGQIVPLKKKFTSYEAYANATIEEVFSKEDINTAKRLGANRFQTSYLENKNGKFTFGQLPVQAQFAPVYAIQSLDINQDGHLDMLLCGNLEKTRVATGKYDANYGVTLLGDGKGNFRYITQPQSGLDLRGDIRDITVLEGGNQQKVLFSVNNGKVLSYTLNTGNSTSIQANASNKK
jgi:hypothetical protein